MPQLFDPDLRRMRRQRAARIGPVTFLHRRAFEDLVERIDDMNRTFDRALLVGALDLEAVDDLRRRVGQLDIVDPAPFLAQQAGGSNVEEARLSGEPASYDLIVAHGTYDTVEPVDEAFLRLRLLLKPDAPLIGVLPGGDLLPALRHAIGAADKAMQTATPHFHPRLNPPALTQLLAAQGFVMPVVDIDRVTVRYGDFETLIADLRGMGATNVLKDRARQPFNRIAYTTAATAFADLAEEDGRVSETIELLHFIGWNPPQDEPLV